MASCLSAFKLDQLSKEKGLWHMDEKRPDAARRRVRPVVIGAALLAALAVAAVAAGELRLAEALRGLAEALAA